MQDCLNFQRSSVALEGEYVHIQEWTQVNKLGINITKKAVP